MVDLLPLWGLRTETMKSPAKSGSYGYLIRFVGCHRRVTKTENRQGRPISKDGVTARRRRSSEFSGDFGSRYSMSTLLPGGLMKPCRQQDVQTIALLHIDADWYASVRIVLETLYDKVVEGGFVVLDDYWRWPGCREAVTDYLKEHQIQGVVLKQADLHGVYFQKPPRCRGETSDN